MTVYKYGGVPLGLSGERVIALGFFDGVHIGHRALFREARRAADTLSVPFAVFTFISESKDVKAGGERLYTTEEKLSLIRDCSADEVILADFASLKSLSPEEFVESFLVGVCGARVCVVGEDFRFGKDARGTADALSELMREQGGEVITVPDVTLFGTKVSTSEIKRALAEGDIERANAMLGSPYFISADVEHGRGVGKTLGYPTINSSLGAKRNILRHGVYLSSLTLDGGKRSALTNVGVCPTFAERESHAETYVLDYEGTLYGERVRIELLAFLREERKFESADELRRQINKDIDEAKRRT